MNPTVLNILGMRKDGPQVWMSLAAFFTFWAIMLAGVYISVRQQYYFGQSPDEYVCSLPLPADLEGPTGVNPSLLVGEADPLEAGQGVAASLEPGHPIGLGVGYYDAWTFSANEGDRIMVAMDSDDVDAHLQVLRDDGTEVARDDDGGTGYNARIDFLAPETGQYTILAASLYEDRTGQYLIRLDRFGDG